MAFCEVCGTEFEAKRVTAKYCSAGCRKLAFQEKEVSVPENAKTPISVPEKVSVPIIKTPAEALKAVQSKPQTNEDRDNWDSPNYDLSEAGFRRRNADWDDDSTYPGTPKSRRSCMDGVIMAHRDLMACRARVRHELDEARH